MSTMRPRPPSSQTLRAQNVARDKDVEQVRRLLSTQPPPPKPAGGGIVGSTLFEIRLDTGTSNGFGGMIAELDQAYIQTDDGAGVSFAGSEFTVGAAGWYSVRATLAGSWSSTVPAWGMFSLATAGDNVGQRDRRPALTDAPQFIATLTQLPVYLEAGGWIGADLVWPGSDTFSTTSPSALYVVRYG